ncbi:MAG: hypothetical protein IT443_10575 [Phycisphaeraceae bacterium]|nr:hypothetical protein [Phycisphaeraceae bacterium]
MAQDALDDQRLNEIGYVLAAAIKDIGLTLAESGAANLVLADHRHFCWFRAALIPYPCKGVVGNEKGVRG